MYAAGGAHCNLRSPKDLRLRARGPNQHRPGVATRLVRRSCEAVRAHPPLLELCPVAAPATYAFAVSRGVIRQVYRIEGWTQHDMRTIEYDSSREKTPGHRLKTIMRWSFTGEPAPEMQRYIGKLVDPPRKQGDANPIKWVNC